MLFWEGGFAELTITHSVAPKKLGRKTDFFTVNFFTLFNQTNEQSPEFLAAQLLRKIHHCFPEAKKYEEFDAQICVDVAIFGIPPDSEYLNNEALKEVEKEFNTVLTFDDGIVRRKASLF